MKGIIYLYIRTKNIVSMPILARMIYRFNMISVKITKGLLVHNYKFILKFIYAAKSIRKAKTILKTGQSN